MIHLLQLQGSRGRLLEVPEFARPPATSEGGTQPPASFLVAWEVDAEQGTGPVLLLARAAHCLQQLHVADAGRQAVAATEYWQVCTDWVCRQLFTATAQSLPCISSMLPACHSAACIKHCHAIVTLCARVTMSAEFFP